jgi:AcrR family transcriptional regulator
MDKGKRTRDRILDKAMCQASKEGLDGLSIGALASALSMSKAGLFAHFGSKEALQVAVLEHTAARYQERIVVPLEAISSNRKRLRVLLEACLNWIDDPSFPGGCPIIRACFDLSGQKGPARNVLVTKQRAFKKRLAEMFRECDLAGADVEQMVFEFRAITLAYQYSSRVLRDENARQRAMRALDALLARIPQTETLLSTASHSPQE